MTETDNNNQQAAGAPAAGFSGLAQSIGTRNLWIIILTMPAVFLLVVAAIIAVFGKPKKEDAEIAAPAVVEETTAAPAAASPIALKAGESAGAIALDGDRLAVRIDGPDGVVVVIYDIAKKEEIARIPIASD
ncbi:hypothetical protein [Hyphococcus sp.]|uniref:hypothetical protein n=1 Tax=Hyphococcus sp. TaxID=2038636 RepID=UPI003D107C49